MTLKTYGFCVLPLVLSATSVGEGLDACSTSGFVIPDGSSSGSTAVFEIPGGSDTQVVLGARLELEIEHPWVGDLVVRLIAPDGTTSVDLLDRVGMVPAGFPGPFGCGGDNILASLEDDALEAADETCTIDGSPVLAGSLRPQQSLSGFIGVNPSGIWQLQISDRQSGDQGSFISACLRLEVAPDCNGDGVPDDCSCQGDLDGDGEVGGSDLARLLSVWGTNDVEGDLDGDGFVGGADLSSLLGNWGLCN
ncbi:MAG: proprotein convertase P-domain-containing protein [Phycisphaerales bacterium]|nr:proprotein convertase P-domain-containing protein [Phycisphaerales bacterium]